jgi:hypothetical protein
VTQRRIRRLEATVSSGHDDRRSDSTHDPAATPMGARRGYVRTITTAMVVLIALVIVWWVLARVVFL